MNWIHGWTEPVGGTATGDNRPIAVIQGVEMVARYLRFAA